MKKSIQCMWLLLLIGVLAMGLPGLFGPSVMAETGINEDPPPPVPPLTPEIYVWYGYNQTFGSFGNPQKQVAILGHVKNTTSLTYSLNGGDPIPLTIGPDQRRLQDPGDFVVELFDGELGAENWVGITAKNTDPISGLFSENSVAVKVNYQRSNRTLLPFHITTWPATGTMYSSAGTLHTVAQAVDGYWVKYGNNIRTAFLGYDRLLAIGDMSWQDYEVLAEIKTFDYDRVNCNPSLFCGEKSGSPGVGIVLRWQGHSDSPISGKQPMSGWLPLGAIGWYRWYPNPTDVPNGSLRIYHDESTSEYAPVSPMRFGIFYMYRMRVETLPDGRPQYSLKVWPKGTSEPGDWDVVSTGKVTDPRSGSVVLFAHHVDIEVGPISVTPLGEQPKAPIVSDDFNVCALDSNVWEFYSPVNQDLASATTSGAFIGNAQLNISVPGNLQDDHHPRPNANNAARLRQTVTNQNFQVEAKFDSGVNSRYQIQGIMIEETDPNNFMRIEFYSDGSNTYMYAAGMRGAGYETFLDDRIENNDTNPLYMRVYRKGDHWVLSYSNNGTTWSTTASFPHIINVNKIGLYAGNAFKPNAPAHVAVVDYFWDTASPIAPEDGRANSLNLSKVGNGQVAKNPDKSTYACGESVELTASSDLGWTFAGWSGSLTSSVNPATVVMNGPKNITGTFTENVYNLTINTAGSGTVNRSISDPYTHGDSVTLTANPQTGYRFVSWSGDLTGTTNPATITMDGNKIVTATFAPIGYVIYVQVDEGGTIQVNPEKLTYTFGEQVTLTAIPTPGWGFSTWAGDIVGTTNPMVVTVSEDLDLTAVFITNKVFLPMVIR